MQAQNYLPHAASAASPDYAQGDHTVLHWYDASRDADVTVRFDPTTGAPQEMRQLTRSSGTVLEVQYKGWNEPVNIQAPR